MFAVSVNSDSTGIVSFSYLHLPTGPQTHFRPNHHRRIEMTKGPVGCMIQHRKLSLGVGVLREVHGGVERVVSKRRKFTRKTARYMGMTNDWERCHP